MDLEDFLRLECQSAQNGVAGVDPAKRHAHFNCRVDLLRWCRRHSQLTRIGHVQEGRQPLWRQRDLIGYEARPSAFLNAKRIQSGTHCFCYVKGLKAGD